VAIKRVKITKATEVELKRLLREVSVLKCCRGAPHIVQLLDIVAADSLDDFDEVFMVFEHVETDLHKITKSNQNLTPRHVQHIMYQILTAMNFLESACVIHRDIKPANLLISLSCRVHLADFGLARVVRPESDFAARRRAYGSFDHSLHVQPCRHHYPAFASCRLGAETPQPPAIAARAKPHRAKANLALTHHVVTRWYRCPELILLQDYGHRVDMWSLGCVLAELLQMLPQVQPDFTKRGPLFPGNSCFPLSVETPDAYTNKYDQLNIIFKVLGTPHADDVETLPPCDAKTYLKALTPRQGRGLAATLPGAPAAALDLLERMLAFAPAKRIT
ncbi:MPK2, partial [Symbiodinium sp. KB8]